MSANTSFQFLQTLPENEIFSFDESVGGAGQQFLPESMTSP